MQYLPIAILSFAFLLQTVPPKTIRAYVEDGVGYAHTSFPLSTVLTSQDLERWLVLLAATPEQASGIQILYEEFAARHNTFFDQHAPQYLQLAAEASTTLQTFDMTSAEFRAALRATDARGAQLRAHAEHLELQCIDSFAPLLSPEQTRDLEVCRGFAIRRRCHGVPSSSHWINFELREVFEVIPPTQFTPAERSACLLFLAEYERVLTELLREWSNAQLAAGERIREILFESAHGGTGLADPRKALIRSSEIGTQIQALHTRAVRECAVLLNSSAAERFSTLSRERLFPELYPDSIATQCTAIFHGMLANEALSQQNRVLAKFILDEHELNYAATSEQLEDQCAAWDRASQRDDVSAPPQGLPAALAPLLRTRTEISRAALASFAAKFEGSPTSEGD